MDNTIESIWKMGFINEAELKAPSVNNLYERKSLLIVDKLIARMKLEFRLLFPLCLMTLLFNLSLGNDVIWSILGAVPFIPWFFIAYNQIQSVKSIPTEETCYEHLIKVRAEVKRIVRFNLRATVASTFLIAFPTFLYTYFNQSGKTFGEMFGVDSLDINRLWIFAIIPAVMLFSYVFFKVMHKLTGGIEQKLDEIITDLESLKS